MSSSRSLAWQSARYTSQHAFDHDLTDKSRPRKGDVLLAKDRTLSRVAIHDGRPAYINQSVALLHLQAIFGQASSNFAVIIDEVHSSQSGKAAQAMTDALTRGVENESSVPIALLPSL